MKKKAITYYWALRAQWLDYYIDEQQKRLLMIEIQLAAFSYFDMNLFSRKFGFAIYSISKKLSTFPKYSIQEILCTL